jgi:hypothetical protein
MKKKITAVALGTLFLAASAGSASATVAPNQGDTDKIDYAVNLPVFTKCASDPVPLDKVEGDFGTKIYVSADKPIAKVTIKSGKDAYVVSQTFGEKWGKIELSKDVSNYVVWVCKPTYGPAAHRPTSAGTHVTERVPIRGSLGARPGPGRVTRKVMHGHRSVGYSTRLLHWGAIRNEGGTSMTTRTNLWRYRSTVTDTSRLVGYDVEATDGHIGKIDAASNDTSRDSLVVDTGFWIFGKKRLIPAGVVTRADHEDRKVHVAMTKDQIKSAPDYDDLESGYDDDYYERSATYYEPYGW